MNIKIIVLLLSFFLAGCATTPEYNLSSDMAYYHSKLSKILFEFRGYKQASIVSHNSYVLNVSFTNLLYFDSTAFASKDTLLKELIYLNKKALKQPRLTYFEHKALVKIYGVILELRSV